MSLLELPNELLCEIFTYLQPDLPYVRLVCQVFNEITRQICAGCRDCKAHNEFVLAKIKRGEIKYPVYHCGYVKLPGYLRRHAFRMRDFVEYLLKNNYLDVFDYMRLPMTDRIMQYLVLYGHARYVVGAIEHLPSRFGTREECWDNYYSCAVWSGNMEILKHLYTIDPSPTWDRLLCIAVVAGHLHVVRWIIEECGGNVFDVYASNSLCETAYQHADKSLFNYLITEPWGQIDWKTLNLIEGSDLKTIKYLHEEEGFPMPDTEIQSSNIYKDLETVKYLHSRSAKLDMQYALRENNIEVIKFLQSCGYVITEDDLSWAMKYTTFDYAWSQCKCSRTAEELVQNELRFHSSFEIAEFIVKQVGIKSICIDSFIRNDNAVSVLAASRLARCSWSEETASADMLELLARIKNEE